MVMETQKNTNMLFENEGIGVCEMAIDGHVVSQNSICEEICGERKGQVCEAGCTSYFKQLNPSRKLRQGFHYFEGKEISGKQFDIVMIKNKNSTISCLRPVASEGDQAGATPVPEGLTTRETEIFKLRTTQRISVTEIAKKLNVSRATVRTHINNINKKLSKSA